MTLGHNDSSRRPPTPGGQENDKESRPKLNGRQQAFNRLCQEMELAGSDHGPNGAAASAEEALSQAELEQIWARRAYALAEEPPEESTGETMDLLVFRLANEQYGLEVSSAREIYPLEQLTRAPRAPDFVAGVFSARGRIISVIDLRAFLGLSATGLSDQTKIMVVTNTDENSETANLELGLLADEVVDVVTIFRDDIEPPLTTQTGARADYIQGVTADMLIVLDLNALLDDKRLIVYEELV